MSSYIWKSVISHPGMLKCMHLLASLCLHYREKQQAENNPWFFTLSITSQSDHLQESGIRAGLNPRDSEMLCKYTKKHLKVRVNELRDVNTKTGNGAQVGRALWYHRSRQDKIQLQDMDALLVSEAIERPILGDLRKTLLITSLLTFWLQNCEAMLSAT